MHWLDSLIASAAPEDDPPIAPPSAIKCQFLQQSTSELGGVAAAGAFFGVLVAGAIGALARWVFG